MIVDRLSGYLSRLILAKQGTFITGRSIFENITLAQEMAHSINKKTKCGNVILKVEMVKGYDRVD